MKGGILGGIVGAAVLLLAFQLFPKLNLIAKVKPLTK